MNDKKNIINTYKLKIKELKLHNEFYYYNDSPKISDSKYDDLKSEIYELEKKYKFLEALNLTKNLVGFTPKNKFKKVKHLRPMLSLSNAFDSNDMIDFQKKINNFLNIKNINIELFAEPKIDGISATLIYDKGVLIKGLSG